MHKDNAAAARRIIAEVWNNGNLDVVDEYLHPKYVHHDPQSPSAGGAAGFKAVVQAFRAAFPDLVIQIDDLIATEDRVVIRYRASGRHDGDLPSVPATGRYAEISGISINRFADGKIVEAWVNWDTLGMLRQLGVLPGSE